MKVKLVREFPKHKTSNLFWFVVLTITPSIPETLINVILSLQ